MDLCTAGVDAVSVCEQRKQSVYIRAGSRHGQGWAEPTQMSVLPTQSELDKD